MKQKVLFLLTLWLTSLAISAQTIDHGDGVVSVQNGNSYKLTRNQKSNNGGSVTMTFSGMLKNGKRNGVWKLTATYNNYGGGNGYFFTGTSTMTRTYSEGVLNGTYTLNQNIKQRTGTYNRYKGGWVYGPVQDGSEHVSGSFNNGKPTGKWIVNCPMLKCSFELADGTPVGDATVSKTAMGNGINMSFRDGYLVKWQPLTNSSSCEGLRWDSTENLATLPNQEDGDLLRELNFLEDYMKGSDLSKWIYGYPKGSPDEKFTIPYKMADRNTHYVLFGNPTDLERKMFESAQKGRRERAEEDMNFSKAKELREKFSQISEPYSKYLEKSEPTFDVSPDYWKLKAYKRVLSSEDWANLSPEIKKHLWHEETYLFNNEKKITEEYKNRMSEIISTLTKYGYERSEMKDYIKNNILNHEVRYDKAKIRYEDRTVTTRKKQYSEICDETPISLADYKFYYKWHEFNKKNIVSPDSLARWRKDVLVNGFAYSKAPVGLDYDNIQTHIKQVNGYEKVQLKSQYQPVYLDYYQPNHYWSTVKPNPFRLLKYPDMTDKEWEKAVKKILKKYPTLKPTD